MVYFFKSEKKPTSFVATPTNVSRIACPPATDKIKINGNIAFGAIRYPTAMINAHHIPAHQ